MVTCVNLGPRQRRRRLRLGLASLAAAAALAVLLADASLPMRTLVFLPLLGAAHGIFQYLEKT